MRNQSLHRRRLIEKTALAIPTCAILRQRRPAAGWQARLWQSRVAWAHDLWTPRICRGALSSELGPAQAWGVHGSPLRAPTISRWQSTIGLT